MLLTDKIWDRFRYLSGDCKMRSDVVASSRALLNIVIFFSIKIVWKRHVEILRYVFSYFFVFVVLCFCEFVNASPWNRENREGSLFHLLRWENTNAQIIVIFDDFIVFVHLQFVYMCFCVIWECSISSTFCSFIFLMFCTVS